MAEMSFYGKVYSEECPGCERVEPQPPGLDIVYENDGFRVHQDYAIPIPHFWIIEAKRHIVGIDEFTDQEHALLGDAWVKTRKAMKEIGKIEKVTEFYQDKSHFHLCLLPDQLWMKDQIPNYHPRNIQTTMQWGEEFLATPEGITEVEKATQEMKSILQK